MKLKIQLTILSSVSIGITLIFQWYVLTQLGPGLETDALFAGMTLPQIVLAIISGSLMHVLVPLLAGEIDDHLRHTVWGIFILVGCLFGLLAGVLYVTASWWIPLTVPGFEAAGRALTVELTRIQLIGMVFVAVNGVQWAAYHAKQQFVWAELAPILSNVIGLLLLIWALPLYGVIAVAWVSTLRAVLQTLLLAPGMGRPVCPNLSSPAISLAWQRIKPLLLGTSYYKTDPLIDRFLLSTAGSGSLSLYYVAQQLYGVANQVVNRAFVVPLMPELSRLHKASDLKKYDQTYRRELLQIGVISLGVMLTIYLFGSSLLNGLIGYGNVQSENVHELWLCMIWLAGMFIGGNLGQVSSSSFYARGDTTRLARISIISFTVYIPIKMAIFYIWGVMGLAVATSVYYVVNFLMQNLILNKKREL